MILCEANCSFGNQVTRPGATLTYTPFDLPKTITQATGTITFAYDVC